jgi:GNAT superfamily N-acetyltransferase
MTLTALTNPLCSTRETCVLATLVTAFAADPAIRWAFPCPNQYLEHFPAFARAFAGKAFDHDTADELTDNTGAALWLPPGIQPNDASVMQVLQHGVDKALLPEILDLFEQMSAFHPSEPHWYLPLIGVDPRAQGKGSGSLLLRRGLDRCDRDGLPAYLEATGTRNVRLYERHAFQPVGRIQTRTSPPIIPMIRPALAPN